VTIETDGAIEQGDALKTTAEGMAATGLHVMANSLDDALAHPAIHARQRGFDALSRICQRCPVATICGGGLYAHRYRADNGFDNPSVYCPDLFKLVQHIHNRISCDIQRLARAGRRLGLHAHDDAG